MYVQMLPFYSICLLTYSHIKIFVAAHKAENVLHAFLNIFLAQHQYACGFLITYSRVSAAIFHKWESGLWTLQQTNINPLSTSGS